MDVVVKGRNVEVPDHFRVHVQEKLDLSERLDPRTYRVDVELFHEKNPRQSSQCQRVEITAYGKGPVVRAEASAETFYAALDAATSKLEARLRKMHDRRRVHHGKKNPVSVAEATAPLAASAAVAAAAAPLGSAAAVATLPAPDSLDGEHAPGSDGALVDATRDLVVRDKTHKAEPMTTEQALHEMELVGHDFYLFADADSGLPSVVYRRHGYDYGVLRLATA